MSDPRTAGEDDGLEVFQVGVDFRVSAGGLPEARELVGQVLTGTRGRDGWVPSGTTPDADRAIGLIDWQLAPGLGSRSRPEPPDLPEEGEPIWPFRIGVDFMVDARDMAEARSLLERALSAEDSDGAPFVTRDRRMVGDLDWGVGGWLPVPPRPSQAALVQERYPGMVGDLAVVEALRTLTDAARRTPGVGLPAGTLDRVREALAGVDPWLRVEDPDSRAGRIVFEGTAQEAASQLAEGVYRGFDMEDREHAVVVGPSELAPSGRVSAAFPKDRHDARALDEISRLLRGHTRAQPLPELVRLISRRVNTTRREGFPSWVPLAGEPEQAPMPASVCVGVITWTDQADLEPTVLASSSPVVLARKLAETLHDTVLQDSDAFAGAVGFLEAHSGPSEWRSPEDVQAWLRAWQAEAPSPSFWMQRITLRDQTPTPPGAPAAPVAAPQGGSADTRQVSTPGGSVPGTYQVPVDFDVCARTPREACDLVEDALTGGVAPGMPGVARQRQPLLAEGGILGVLGWHRPEHRQAHAADPVRAVLDERAAALTDAADRPANSPGAGSPGRDGREAR